MTLEQKLKEYIVDKRTQEECSAFIDGFQSAEKIYKEANKSDKNSAMIAIIGLSVLLLINVIWG